MAEELNDFERIEKKLAELVADVSTVLDIGIRFAPNEKALTGWTITFPEFENAGHSTIHKFLVACKLRKESDTTYGRNFDIPLPKDAEKSDDLLDKALSQLRTEKSAVLTKERVSVPSGYGHTEYYSARKQTLLISTLQNFTNSGSVDWDRVIEVFRAAVKANNQYSKPENPWYISGEDIKAAIDAHFGEDKTADSIIANYKGLKDFIAEIDGKASPKAGR